MQGRRWWPQTDTAGGKQRVPTQRRAEAGAVPTARPAQPRTLDTAVDETREVRREVPPALNFSSP